MLAGEVSYQNYVEGTATLGDPSRATSQNATLRSEIHITALAETGVHSFRATNRMNTYQFRRTRTLTLFRRLASPGAPVHGPSSPLDAYPILGRVNRPTRHPPLPHPPLGVRRSRASERRRVREPETHEPLDDGPRSGPRCGREQSLGQSPGHAHDRAARLEGRRYGRQASRRNWVRRRPAPPERTNRAAPAVGRRSLWIRRCAHPSRYRCLACDQIRLGSGAQLRPGVWSGPGSHV